MKVEFLKKIDENTNRIFEAGMRIRDFIFLNNFKDYERNGEIIKINFRKDEKIIANYILDFKNKTGHFIKKEKIIRIEMKNILNFIEKIIARKLF